MTADILPPRVAARISAPLPQHAAPPAPAKTRLAGLDLLRCLAILLVLGRHLHHPPEGTDPALKLFADLWYRAGWVGVDLFFVLSGFLVSGLLFAEYRERGRLSAGRFYWRRGWKIYPPFVAMIATTVAVNCFVTHKTFYPRQVAAELMFVQNYVPGLWWHTWSLAVEEHFYLALPALLLVMLRLNRRSAEPLRPVVWVAAAALVGVLALRVGNALVREKYNFFTHHMPTHLRVDALFAGVALAYAYHFRRDAFTRRLRPWRRPLAVGGLLLFVPAFLADRETTPLLYTAGFTLFTLAGVMLLGGMLLCELPKNRAVRGGAAVGAYSYSIYLWHMPALAWGVPLAEKLNGAPLGYAAAMGVYLVGAVLFGILMSKLVEGPVLRLRDRLFPSHCRGALGA